MNILGNFKFYFNEYLCNEMYTTLLAKELNSFDRNHSKSIIFYKMFGIKKEADCKINAYHVICFQYILYSN